MLAAAARALAEGKGRQRVTDGRSNSSWSCPKGGRALLESILIIALARNNFNGRHTNKYTIICSVCSVAWT